MNPRLEKAILAGGCFWGMQDLIRKRPGVIETQVGYSGGTTTNPTYADIKTGKTGHAEAIEITFDPAKTSYRDILEFFFQMHDPTTQDRQGNDRGSQYRSAIFTLNEEQAQIARAVIAELNAAKIWKDPIVTQVVPAGPFTRAEHYHQDYLEKNPGGYTCHFVRPRWKTEGKSF